MSSVIRLNEVYRPRHKLMRPLLYRSGVHNRRIRIPKSLQPRVSQFVRAGMQAALKVFL
jgi:hypothetical protein